MHRFKVYLCYLSNRISRDSFHAWSCRGIMTVQLKCQVLLLVLRRSVHFRFRCPCFQVTPLAGWRSIPKLGVNCTSGNVDQVLPFPALPPIVPLTQGRYHRPDWTNSAANFHFPPCPLTHDPLLSLRDQCSGDHCGYLVSPMMAYCQYMPRFLPSSLHRLFIYFSLVGKG